MSRRTEIINRPRFSPIFHRTQKGKETAEETVGAMESRYQVYTVHLGMNVDQRYSEFERL